jgi:hypothetical protein
MDNRRYTDSWTYTVRNAATLIGAIGVLGGALFWVGDTRFETKTNAAACRATIERDATETKNSVLEMRKDIQYIREGMDRIERRGAR